MQLESYFKRINWSSSSKTFWQILAYLFKLLIKADMVWIWVKVKIKPHCMRLFPNERHHPLTIMLRVVTRDTMRVCLIIVFSLLQTLIDNVYQLLVSSWPLGSLGVAPGPSCQEAEMWCQMRAWPVLCASGVHSCKYSPSVLCHPSSGHHVSKQYHLKSTTGKAQCHEKESESHSPWL